MRGFVLFLLSLCLFSCGNDPRPAGKGQQEEKPAANVSGNRKPTDSLRSRLAGILRDKRATVGIAIMDTETGDTVLVDGDRHFPLMSVAKFPQALLLLQLADSGRYDVGAPLQFGAEDLKQRTFSTLRKDHPQSSFTLSLPEALRYSIGQSDNVTSNKIFELEGGPQAVEEYIHRIGIRDMGFGTNYAYSAPNAYRLNWSTPRAMAQLLQKFHRNELLSDSSKSLLWKAMLEATSGPDRLRGGVPAGTPVAHKTGTSGIDAKTGINPATNDVGLIQLPSGKWIAVVVFVADSKESDKDNAAIIAAVAKAAWEHFAL